MRDFNAVADSPCPEHMLASLIFLVTSLVGPLSEPDAVARPTPCETRDFAALRRNPTVDELRCRYGVEGPGRFGLLSYTDVPVYQPATPMPGTHLIGVPGHTGPSIGESFEEWEWRVLRTSYGADAHQVNRGLELLDPFVASRIMRFESRLAEEGVRARRRETWRSPVRQAYLFQQGRSRPGFIATATLTSWHSEVDASGNPAGRAVDYDVTSSSMLRFHEIAAEVGLSSFGADSYDPGHVFVPMAQDLSQDEIALLRLLPRVPEVTLSTGLPVDARLPEGGAKALHARSRSFAESPFVPYPAPLLASRLPTPGVRKSDRAEKFELERLAANALRELPAASSAGAGDGARGPSRTGAAEEAE